MPKVIFLNGASSSGKTSIAKALQYLLPKPYMLLGIDKMISMMPEHLNNWQGKKVERGFWWQQDIDEQGNKTSHIMFGDVAKNVSISLKSVVLALINDGHNVIVDEICVSKDQVVLWQRALKKIEAYYICVSTDLKILEARELVRGNRMSGSARAQAPIVHGLG